MPRSHLAVLTIFTLAAHVASGCRQLAGIDTPPPAQDACDACITRTCADAVTACVKSPACDARRRCDARCDLSDAHCVEDCAAANPGGGDAFADVTACASVSCTDACANKCGYLVAASTTSTADVCAACMGAHCCADGEACAQNASCARILECLPSHPLVDQLNGCAYVRYPDGSRAYQTWRLCRASACSEECTVGKSWSCVDKVGPPAAQADTISETLVVVDAAQQSQPVPGLEVRVCFPGSRECESPAGPVVVTDARGRAPITIPMVSALGRTGFVGYLEVRDPNAKYITNLIFSNGPLTEPNIDVTVVATTQATLDTFTSFLGVKLDASHGMALVTANDCLGEQGVGVQFKSSSMDPVTRIGYLRYGVPSATAIDTDTSGTAIVGPVLPGTLSIDGFTGDPGQRVASAQVVIRAGAISIVGLGAYLSP